MPIIRASTFDKWKRRIHLQRARAWHGLQHLCPIGASQTRQQVVDLSCPPARSMAYNVTSQLVRSGNLRIPFFEANFRYDLRANYVVSSRPTRTTPFGRMAGIRQFGWRRLLLPDEARPSRGSPTSLSCSMSFVFPQSTTRRHRLLNDGRRWV